MDENLYLLTDREMKLIKYCLFKVMTRNVFNLDRFLELEELYNKVVEITKSKEVTC